MTFHAAGSHVGVHPPPHRLSTSSIADDHLYVLDEYIGMPDAFVEPTRDLLARCYAPYRTETAFEHTYGLEDWRSMVTSSSFYTAVAWLDGEPVGLTGYETDLGRAPLLHREYFTTRFPGERVFYCTDLAVDPRYRNRKIVSDICRTGAQFARDHDARVVFYTARFNVEAGFVDLLANVIRDELTTPIDQIDEVRFFSFRLSG